MPAKKWTDEQQQHALALYAKDGPAEAARQTGIPKGTIASWARRTGVHTAAPATSTTATIVAAQRWAERRLSIADTFGAAAEEFMHLAMQHARGGEGKTAKDLALCSAIAFDKAELRAGGVTGRLDIGDVTDRDARLALVRDIRSGPRKADAS